MKKFIYDTAKSVIKVPSIPYNLIRDLTWAGVTLKKYDLAWTPSSNATAQFYSQWIYPTLAMFFACRVQRDFSEHILHTKLSPKALIAVIAASVAIPVWNKAGQLGQKIGEKIGLTSVAAGYFAAPFTGIAEGFTQEMITSVFSALCIAEERNSFVQNPGQYLINFAKKIGFSLTIGMIPGATWQLIAQACQTNDVNLTISIVSIAFGVAICNIIYTRSQEKVLNRVSNEGEFFAESSSGRPRLTNIEHVEIEDEDEIKSDSDSDYRYRLFPVPEPILTINSTPPGSSLKS